tara:strand:- start:119 stop:241 length:123 start_codon:yes stop_codon:yes gene_type:complete
MILGTSFLALAMIDQYLIRKVSDYDRERIEMALRSRPSES